jgi:deoxyribodipyrimidine photo-lyase
MVEVAIVWLRRDLRLADNAALYHAVRLKVPIIPVYLHAPESEAPWQPGSAARYWLHRSLAALQEELRARSSRLILRRGEPETVLEQLVSECRAAHLYWNRLYEPSMLRLDARVQARLRHAGVSLRSFPGHLLNEPDTVMTRQGTPFKVFTPYWRESQRRRVPGSTLPAPRQIAAPARWPASDKLEALALLPAINWHGGMDETWTPGCRGARSALRAFTRGPVQAYNRYRDYPAAGGVSRLSPHLHFGEISPGQVVTGIIEGDRGRGLLSMSRASEAFLRQLYWRDFAHYLLYHYPRTATQPMQEKFRRFPWRKNRRLYAAWCHGRTGYPIVDAGMRELWHTGWMHNRVRMITASFLVKDLMIHWRDGARWFWDTLVDADLANNTLGWQWTAGCGADAAPFFRVFNPVTQGEKFDPDGAYVRHWVPELAGLAKRFIHKPWQAPLQELEAAGLRLERDYPAPVVDHAAARLAALEAYQRIK